MMKKMVRLLAHGLVTGGMIYGLIALFAVPAAACTHAECSDLQQIADEWCRTLFCDGGGYLRFCNSAGFGVTCLYANGAICTSFSGQCGN